MSNVLYNYIYKIKGIRSKFNLIPAFRIKPGAKCLEQIVK
jgi:hypothetical protein